MRARGRYLVRHLARGEGSEAARDVVALRRGPHGVLRQAHRPRHARSCRAERPLEAGPLGGALRADGEGGGRDLPSHHVLPRHRAESDGSRSQLEQYELAGCGGQLGKKELELGLERGPQPRSQRATVAAEPQEAERHEERHPADVFTGVGERVRQRQRVHGGVSPEQRTRRWLYVVGAGRGCARAAGSRRVRRARGRELYQHSAPWAANTIEVLLWEIASPENSTNTARGARGTIGRVTELSLGKDGEEEEEVDRCSGGGGGAVRGARGLGVGCSDSRGC